MLPTSTTRLSLLIHPTLLSETMLVSTGSARLFTSTERDVVSPLLVRSPEVSESRVTEPTTPLVVLTLLPGSAETPFLYADTVKFRVFFEYILFFFFIFSAFVKKIEQKVFFSTRVLVRDLLFT